jgi:hypothetical protein
MARDEIVFEIYAIFGGVGFIGKKWEGNWVCPKNLPKEHCMRLAQIPFSFSLYCLSIMNTLVSMYSLSLSLSLSAQLVF